MSTPDLTEALRPVVRQLVAEELASMPPAPDAPPPSLTSKEAAARARVCLTTIQRWTRSGRLPSHRVGRRLRILVSDLDATIRGSK